MSLSTKHKQSTQLLDLFIILLRGIGSTKFNINTTTSHVGGNRHRPLRTGFGNNFTLALVILCVQHLVGNSLLAEIITQELVLFNRYCTNQYRLPFLIKLLHLSSNRIELP